MVSSRIEQKIEDIYAFVESCKPQALSQSKVVVPKNAQSARCHFGGC